MTKTHDQEFFYKYTDANGAKCILSDLTTKWSSPLSFNDPFDCQIVQRFSFSTKELEEALRSKTKNLILSDIHIDNSSSNLQGQLILEMRRRRSRITLKELNAFIEFFIQNRIKITNEVQNIFVEEKNYWLEKLRLFCVTEEKNNLLMWAHYADQHKGAVIKFRCIPKKDTPLCAAKEVSYHKEIPLIADFDGWIAHSTGEKLLDMDRYFENAVFTKSNHWGYEKEWRVILKKWSDNEFNTLKIYPEEIESIYLGCKMTDAVKKEIQDIIENRLTHVKVFQAKTKEKEYGLEFERIK